MFVLTTALGAFPLQASAATVLSDVNGHWAQSQIETMITKGVVAGYPDNTFKPDKTITRAEFITMTNKAFSFTTTAEINYPDVNVNDWFAKEITIAKAAGYISGYLDGTMKPNSEITRQEVATIITQILKLDTTAGIGELSKFTDSASIPTWSGSAIAAMVKAGYLTGYPDGTFKALNPTTRAMAAVILTSATGGIITPPVQQKVFDKAGTYGPATGTDTITGDVTISAAGVILQNVTIKGDLLVAQSVGEGDVTFKNITVTGTTTIKGGGANSVTFDKCIIGLVIVNKTTGQVRVVFLNNSQIGKLQVDTVAKIVGDGILIALINANGVVIDSTPGTTTLKAGISASVGGKTVYGTPTSGGGGGGGGGAPVNVPVAGITLNTNSITLNVGQTSNLFATIAPANATNKNVTWTSDRPGAATVVNGLVTAVGKGVAVITATTVDGSITATCTVTVTVPVSGVSLSKNSLSMQLGGATATLVPLITPADANNKAVNWASVDETIATVVNGVVTAQAVGTTAITATTVDGAKVASCTVTVELGAEPVMGVTLNYNSYTLNVGDNDLVLVPFISPANATNTNVAWSTNAPGVATVDNGTITAVGPGNARITVTADDGGWTATCDITVITPVSGITLDITSISDVFVGDADANLVATINPGGADNKQVVWTSTNPAIATFIETAPGALTGIVRYIGPGTTTITATTVDGGYAASCIVTVGMRVSAVTLSPATGTLKVGGSTLTLIPTFSPTGSTHRSVTWNSSDTGKATVTGGVVSPVAAGTVTITATPVFGTVGATPGTSIIDVFNVTKGTMIKDSTLLAGKTVASVSFTIAGPALPLNAIGVTLNDGTVLQYNSLNAGVYTYTGSTNTNLAGVTSTTVKLRNTVSFVLNF
jgi:uncharacterized protein YjdB